MAKKKVKKKAVAKKAVTKKSPKKKVVAKKSRTKKVAKKTPARGTKSARDAKPQATIRAKKSAKRESAAKRVGAAKQLGKTKPQSVAPSAPVARTKSVSRSTPVAPPPPPPAPAVGSFVWHELMTTDASRCGDFYQGMFNWARNEMEMIPGVTYTIFRNAGKDCAGMMTMAGPDWEGQPARWIPYVKVKNVDAAALKATQLGGRVVVPPSDIPVGRFAVVADPTGTTIGVFKPESA